MTVVATRTDDCLVDGAQPDNLSGEMLAVPTAIGSRRIEIETRRANRRDKCDPSEARNGRTAHLGEGKDGHVHHAG